MGLRCWSAAPRGASVLLGSCDHVGVRWRETRCHGVGPSVSAGVVRFGRRPHYGGIVRQVREAPFFKSSCCIAPSRVLQEHAHEKPMTVYPNVPGTKAVTKDKRSETRS